MKFVPTYDWKLTDLQKVEKNGLRVFSCFSCGGGSTMGYKLAGYNMVGANEIDPEMAWHYKENHHPKHYFLEDIRVFNKRENYPDDLKNLDILDGSPPCSSFSMAGARESQWGKKKVFREGQAEQVLDDLFFEFIELVRRLQPKVVVAENVKGMIQGNAKGFVKQIISMFNVCGYDVQLFLLNAASMGVPQARERVFFICRRKDLNLAPIKLAFNQKTITVRDAIGHLEDIKRKPLTAFTKRLWEKSAPGKSMAEVNNGNGFNNIKFPWNAPAPTIASSGGNYHPTRPGHLEDQEYVYLGSFPQDYKFSKPGMARYMIGMSVPPLMTYSIANQIYEQWLKHEQ